MISDAKSRLNRIEMEIDDIKKVIDGIQTLLKYFNSTMDTLAESLNSTKNQVEQIAQRIGREEGGK